MGRFSHWLAVPVLIGGFTAYGCGPFPDDPDTPGPIVTPAGDPSAGVAPALPEAARPGFSQPVDPERRREATAISDE